MLMLALKMLIGNRASFIGIIFGIFLATLLVSQQSAIFLGLLSRSYRMLTDIHSPNIWVVDPGTESDEKARLMPDVNVNVVRSIAGIEWAVPLNRVVLPLVSPSGIYDLGQLYGIDDATLIGAPTEIIEGRIQDLRREGGVIVDVHSAHSSLAKTLADGTKIPLKLGDTFEINSHRAVVVGISNVTRGFYPEPVIYTANSSLQQFNPSIAHHAGFFAAKSLQGANVDEILKQVNAHPGLKAFTREEFRSSIIHSFLKTGILINFGLSVALGIIIGFSVAGQIFYIMNLENLKYYALIKAVGGSQKTLVQMIGIQALLVGVIGFLLGIGSTLLWGMAVKGTTLAFLFTWQLLLFTAGIVFLICLFTAGLSIRKVISVDPKELMGN